MTEFKIINDQLCRMVEPEPLQLDSPMPCVVRLIQDDSPMGIYNQDMYQSALHVTEMCVGINGNHDIKTVVSNIPGSSLHYAKYEIIGYPVEEGSIEWAWYQRCMLDIPVIGPNGVKPNNNFTLKQWCGQYSLTSMKTGWQLYEPKPLLSDAMVGDIIKVEGSPNIFSYEQITAIANGFVHTDNAAGGFAYEIATGIEPDANAIVKELIPLAPIGSAEWAWQMAKLGIETKCSRGKIRISKSGMIEVCYNGMAYAMPMTQSPENRQYVINKMRECSPDGWQLYEPKPEPQPAYAVGDWVEWCGDQYMVESAPPQSGSHYNIRSPYEELGCSVYPENITRKLSPSEVVVHIGCLSGTVEKASDFDLFLLWHSKKDCDYSMIRFDALDEPTLKLVRDLLDRQKEGK